MASTSITMLDDMTAYADRFVRKDLVSQLFNVSPTLALIAKSGGNASDLGKPGVDAIIGGTAKGWSKSRRKAEAGMFEYHVRFQNEKIGGTKNLGLTDTTASVGNNAQNRVVKSAAFRWVRKQTPIAVDNWAVKNATGKYEIAKVTEEAVEMAREEHIESLAAEMITGNPADQDVNVWSAMLGFDQAMDNDNTYGGVARGTYTGWAGNAPITASKSASLDLIDDANLVRGIAKKNRPVDLAVTTYELFHTIKKEALARGGAQVINPLPELSKVGTTFEAVQYGQCLIIPDPNVASGDFYCTNTRDWLFMVRSGDNMRVAKFVDPEDLQPGAADQLTSSINTQYMLVNLRPLGSIKYDTVS